MPLAADVDLAALAERYALYGGAIQAAVLGAARSALGRGAEVVAMMDLEEAARRAEEASDG
jgi:ATP-dependent 26S proteasome regulatory subunit